MQNAKTAICPQFTEFFSPEIVFLNRHKSLGFTYIGTECRLHLTYGVVIVYKCFPSSRKLVITTFNSSKNVNEI